MHKLHCGYAQLVSDRVLELETFDDSQVFEWVYLFLRTAENGAESEGHQVQALKLLDALVQFLDNTSFSDGINNEAERSLRARIITAHRALSAKLRSG